MDSLRSGVFFLQNHDVYANITPAYHSNVKLRHFSKNRILSNNSKLVHRMYRKEFHSPIELCYHTLYPKKQKKKYIQNQLQSLSGIGYATCVLSCWTNIYYIIILAWALFYFLVSLRAGETTCILFWQKKNASLCMQNVLTTHDNRI